MWSTLGATLPSASLVSRSLSRRPRLSGRRSSRESVHFRGSVLSSCPQQVSRGPAFLRNVPVSSARFFVTRQSSPVGVGEVRPAATGLCKSYRDIPGEREKPGLLTPASYFKSHLSTVQSPWLVSLLTFVWLVPLAWLPQIQKGNSASS